MQEVQCFDLDGKTVLKTIEVPEVMKVPIRKDIVEDAFKCINMGRRQPYAVSPTAGKEHSAHSWGTGRAMARVPRVSGSGTSRAGQAAFANFARKGRMAHPTKVLRRWQRKFNKNGKRHAIAMALAATAVPALLESRGHSIDQLNSIPLIISNEIKNISKTKDAFQILKNFNFQTELEQVKDSKHIRAGKGKSRNRKYKIKKGILIIYKEKSSMIKAFRNIEGVELMSIDRMNLLKLCPGGHLGRLCLWTEEAFTSLGEIYNLVGQECLKKKNYYLPFPIISNEDVDSIFYSEKVQALLDNKKLLETPKFTSESKEIERMNGFFDLVN